MTLKKIVGRKICLKSHSFYHKSSKIICWTLDVSGQRPMTSFSSVCPSVSPRVRHCFLKIGSLVFSDIVHIVADHDI